MIFKEIDKIQFVSTVEGLESVEECVPKPAKHFIPKWFKDIPSDLNMTVKNCPSFPDYFSQGYIIPMWSDVLLKYDDQDKNWRWETPSDKFQWGAHTQDQFLEYTNPSFNGSQAQFVFKTDCPWRIMTPPGWSVLQLPLFYHFNNEWSVLPGVIDTDIHSEVNQQVLYHGNGKEIKINAGDPFVLYIPFKRSNKIKHEVRYQTEKDRKIILKHKFNTFNKFLPSGHYRKIQRERDKNF